MIGPSPEAELGRRVSSDQRQQAADAARPPAAFAIAGALVVLGLTMFIVGLAAMWPPLAAVIGGPLLVGLGVVVARIAS